MKQYLKNFFFIDVPLLLIMFQIMVELFVPALDKPAFHSEGGPHETVEAFTIFGAIPIAIYLSFKVKNKWLRIWTITAAICSIYVFGEELSWGQTAFHWHTPENWAAINDQDETNLHNTSDWFDQKPRALLMIGILVGGLVVPALRRWKPEWLPKQFEDIYPDDSVVFTAFCALCIKLGDTIMEMFGSHLFWRTSEVMEMFMYYFVFLYLLSLKRLWKEKGVI